LQLTVALNGSRARLCMWVLGAAVKLQYSRTG
jgi:hypothetical protein